MGDWGFSTIYIVVQIEVLFDTLKVLFKRNVSTNFVTDCSYETVQYRLSSILDHRCNTVVQQPLPVYCIDGLILEVTAKLLQK